MSATCRWVGPLVLVMLAGFLTVQVGSQEPRPRETAPAVVSGRVFLDRNRNGKREADEQGLAGVAVSDGIQFVVTRADGSYELKIAADPLIPHRPAQVVSMSWPSDKWPTAA